MPGLVAWCNNTTPRTGWSVTANSQEFRSLRGQYQLRNIKMKLIGWKKYFEDIPCFVPAPSASGIRGNSLSWRRGVRVQHAKVIRNSMLSLVFLGTSVRLMELWGQAGGRITNQAVLNVSKGDFNVNVNVNIFPLKKHCEHSINFAILQRFELSVKSWPHMHMHRC